MVKLEEPDKGQAWVVAICACIINMILSGLSRMIGLLYVAVIESYGVSRQQATLPFTVRNAVRCLSGLSRMIGLLYVAVIETYGVSRQQATLPFTARNAVRCLSGPIVGVVGQRYGIRAVTFCGGIVAAMGASLCCIAPNVIWLAVFWGGMHGFGFAFANTLFQVVVNQYFQKYRATASGIALSGACVGSFVFPIMIEAILNTFGLSGGFLILGGVVMHVLPPSLLLKSPPWIENPEQYARLKAIKMKQESVETLQESMPDSPPEGDGEEEHLREWRGLMRSTSLNNCPVEELDICSTTRSLKGSTQSLATFTYQNFGSMKEKKPCKRNVICTLYKIKESPQLSRRNSSMNGSATSVEKSHAVPIPTISGDLEKKENDINASAPCEKIPDVSPGNQTSLSESIRGIAILYTNPAYVLINVCMTTYVLIFIPILTVIVDYGKDKGIPESYGKYLINAMAMGDLIGRLCFGWVTDKKLLTIPVFITLAFILQGVFIALFPLATDIYSFMLLLTLYGVTAGTVLVHFPLLVLRYVDMNLQSVAMGCVGFLSGIISFAIPPMIGHFRDHVGSYDGMFYLTGGISVVSGGFWLLEPILLKLHHEKAEQNKILREEKNKKQTFEKSKSTESISNMNGQKTR